MPVAAAAARAVATAMAGAMAGAEYVSQPAFVSVFGNDSNHRCLLLPPQFVENYAERVSRDCRIRGPDGVEWNATVGGAGLSSIGMRRGWSNFAVAYGLEAGEVLVVRLVEESVFQVEIFGARSRVNMIPLQPTAATSERDDEGRRLAQEEEEIVVTPPPASAAPPSTSLVVYDPNPSNKRKRSDDSTEAERRALELAREFTSENPFSVVVMNESHVYCPFWMGMKKAFAREHLPSQICDMMLVDKNGDRWGGTYLGPRHEIVGGWKKFALDHLLEEGDVVVFERIDRTQLHPVLLVHIFRALLMCF